MFIKRKVKAGGAGGAVATLVMVVLGQFGIDLPPGTEAAIATIAGTLLSFWVKEPR
jgi:putative flippase GtrA